LKQRYVLTERGKLLVATLIVLGLILPSVIILFRVSLSDIEPDSQNGGSHLVSDQPADVGLPPDTGLSPSPEISNDGSVIVFDIDAGAMTIVLSSGFDFILSDYAVSKIGELLTSPLNTEGATFSADIPFLPDAEAAILTSSIIDAFMLHGVVVNDIIFFVYQHENDEEFNINIQIRHDQ